MPFFIVILLYYCYSIFFFLLYIFSININQYLFKIERKWSSHTLCKCYQFEIWLIKKNIWKYMWYWHPKIYINPHISKLCSLQCQIFSDFFSFQPLVHLLQFWNITVSMNPVWITSQCQVKIIPHITKRYPTKHTCCKKFWG